MSRPLRLQNIAHAMREGTEQKQMLAPISRAFTPAKFSVVSGPSGAGKTTLLSILSLTVRASQGDVFWGNDNLSALPPAEQAHWRRNHLGLVFQTSRLVGVMTAHEHIQLTAAIRRVPKAEADGLEILRMLGMGDKLRHVPSTLSGGEKQRIAIAQALCFKPSILLADEPTAALDNTNAKLVAETLRAYAQNNNAIVICVSHDHAVIDRADDHLVLEKA